MKIPISYLNDLSFEQLYDMVVERTAAPSNQAKKDLPWPRFSTYLENLGWIQLLGFDMNRTFEDPLLQCETQCRLKLYHMENFNDDTFFDTAMAATIGMYFDYPLIGIAVGHQPDGVPIFAEDHPIRKTPDLRLLKPIDFYNGGDMPKLFSLYEGMKKIAAGRFKVNFPTWSRGPLDMAMGLRGYEQFVEDTMERPQFVHGLMQYLVDQRIRWWEEYLRWSGTTERACGIGDDWINVPFISPAMFEEFCVPYYLQLEKFHGKLGWLHSCGDKVPVQKMILRIKTITDHEVNHWTSLDGTLANIPPHMFLCVNLLNADVLLADEAKMEADLQEILTKCAGRKFQVVGSAMEKMHDDMGEDLAQMKRWVAIARRLFGRDGK